MPKHDSEKRLSTIESAIHLKMSPRLLEHFTKQAVKYKEKTKLPCDVQDEVRWYRKEDLDQFDAYLRAPWPKNKNAQRPSLPRKIKEEIMLEAACVCPVCGFESAGEAAHIEPVSKTLCHHPSNLIWLCPNHHTVVDKVAVASNVTMSTVKTLKEIIVDRQLRAWRLERAASSSILELMRNMEILFLHLSNKDLEEVKAGINALAENDLETLTKTAKKVANVKVAKGDTLAVSKQKFAKKVGKVSAKTKVSDPKSISTWQEEAGRERETYLLETGQVDCPLCEGDGFRNGDDCTLCHGESALPASLAEQADLSDFEEIDCPVCDGDGVLRGEPCKLCDGESRMERRFAAQVDPTDYDLVNCPVCGGEGIQNGEDCPLCGGERELEARIAVNVDLSEYDLVDCRLCEGHGSYDGSDCPACGGEKQMPNYASEQMDWAQFDMVDCPRCDGSGQGDYGDCQVCGGESKVPRRFRDQYE